MRWAMWRKVLENRANRLERVEPIGASALSDEARAAVARTLADFQAGESNAEGEIRIDEEIRRFRDPALDEDQRACLALVLAEERRHARILARCVEGLGGAPVVRPWSERLFVWGYRVGPVPLKLVVLAATEAVGGAFYELLVSRLPPSPLRAALEEVRGDEHAHLGLHLDLFRTWRGWRRAAFLAAWRVVATCACLTLVAGQRRTMATLGVRPQLLVGRLFAAVRAVERESEGWPREVPGIRAAA